MVGFQKILKYVTVTHGWEWWPRCRQWGSEQEPIPSGATSSSEPQSSFCCWLSSIHSSWSKYTVMSSNVTGACKEKWHQLSANFFLSLPHLSSQPPEDTPTPGTDQTGGGGIIHLHTRPTPHHAHPLRASHSGNETRSSRNSPTLEQKCHNEGQLRTHTPLPACSSPACPRDPLLLSQCVSNNQQHFFCKIFNVVNLHLGRCIWFLETVNRHWELCLWMWSIIKTGKALQLRTIFHGGL